VTATTTAPLRRALAGLRVEERAAVVAAASRLGPRAPAVLARLGEACAEVATALAAAPREQRARLLATELAVLRAPVPAGVSRIHREWIDEALAGEPAEIRAAVAGAGTSAEPARSWLQRRAFGHLIPMIGDGSELDVLLDVPFAGLVRGLERSGGRTVADLLRRASPHDVAAIAARLGEPRGSVLIDEVVAARRRSADVPRVRSSALADLVATAPWERTDVLAHVGAVSLAPALALRGGDWPGRVAQRLPCAIGRALLCAVPAEPAADAAPALAAELARFLATVRA
jgi:hypothetical protein